MSVNDFPSYSPDQVIGLPTCQSVSTREPNMNAEIASGSVSASHTWSGEAEISVSACAMWPCDGSAT